jgi:hypothetical protein
MASLSNQVKNRKKGGRMRRKEIVVYKTPFHPPHPGLA